jgi:hypothetical protein
MLGNDSLPRPPRSSRTLDDYRDTSTPGEPERRVEKRPSNESLFGSFIKSRTDAADFKAGREPSKSRSKSDRRRKSKSPSASTASQDSSPGAPSPRSRSPRNSKYRKSPSSQKSPRYPSPKSKSPGHRKSPRIKGEGHLSSDARNELDGSFPDLGSTPRGGDRNSAQSDDDVSSLPALVDDSIVRERVEGYRGGKQWNILEDTPGGHAVEKLIIVAGIEYFGDEEDEWLEEDEDIEDDPLMDYISHSDRDNRKQSLPSDPSAKRGAATQRRKPGAGRDRFDPSFAHNDMWATDDEQDAKLSRSQSGSGDVSILSDHIGDVDTVSELGVGSAAYTDDQTLTITTDEASQQKLRLDEKREGDDDSNISKTPATTKRSGGRPHNIGNVERLPNLSGSLRTNNIYDEEDIEGSLKHPASVPEDAPLSTSKRKSRRKKRTSTSAAPLSPRQSSSSHKPPSSYERAKGNSNSGRSSNRRSAHTHSRTAAGMERNAMRSSRGGRQIPDMVPATPMRDTTAWMRCSPMSSSLTSTPTSLVSGMQHRQQASLQHLRSRRKKKNKPLHAHVGRETSPPPEDTGDDNTLGASTITTNFSTTQRTRGDNTVSTRSLFRSDQMSHSETLKIPQRKREDSDYEPEQQSEADDQSSTMVDEVEELHGSAEIEHFVSSYEILEAAKPAPEGRFKTMLRRPSGEGDDLFDAFDFKSSDVESDDDSSGASDFLRWQKENEQLISPKVDLKKTIEPGTHAFLELHVDGNGVQVDSKVAEVPNFSTALQISGGIDETKPAEKTSNDGVAKLEVRDVPQLRQMNGEVMRAPDSPLDRFGKKKKPKGGRLGLFKRVQSWKGVVALSDDED